MTTHKPGPKPKAANRVQNKILPIRFSGADLTVVTKAAKKAELPVSTYIRTVAIAKARLARN